MVHEEPPPEELHRFREMVESAHEGIWEVDSDGRTIFANVRLCEMLACPLEEILGCSFLEFMLPEDHDQALARFAARREGEAGVVEHRLVTRDGAVIWVNLSTFPRASGEGSVVGMISDITELKRIQGELEESRTKYRTLVENSPDAIVRFDRELRHIFVNRRLEELVGLPREEYLGKTNEELGFPPETVERWNRELNRVIETGEPNTFPFEFQGADGAPRYLEARVAPEFDSDGRIEALQSTLRDITGHREAEERLRKLTANVPGVVYQFVLERDGSVHIPVAAGKDMELLGFAAAEVKEDATPALSLVHPDDEAEFLASIARSAADLTPWHQRYRVEHPERGLLWVEGEALPERLPSGGTLWHGYIRDVTEQQLEQEMHARLEDRVRYQQRLESLGVLAGGIAHDFNNILMTVIGNAELALSELQAMDPDSPGSLQRARSESVDSLHDINMAAHQAAALCRQMLNYAGESSFELRRVDLCEVVREIDHLLGTSISENARLTVDCPDHALPARVDPNQIRQVILNMTLNASEAIGPDEGEILVEVAPTVLDGHSLRSLELDGQLEPGRYGRITIADDGEGMDPETARRVFDPFFSTRFTGRGLGLPSALGIIRGHGGGLAIESAPGKGTSFQVFLPLDESDGELPDAGDSTGIPETGTPDNPTGPASA